MKNIKEFKQYCNKFIKWFWNKTTNKMQKLNSREKWLKLSIISLKNNNFFNNKYKKFTEFIFAVLN